jgi:hypothetical protein
VKTVRGREVDRANSRSEGEASSAAVLTAEANASSPDLELVDESGGDRDGEEMGERDG